MGKVKTFRARVSVAGKRIRVDVAVPKLVGVTRAAELLGVQKGHVGRFRERGRLDAIEVEGSAPVFLLTDVERLAGELKGEREARATAAAS